MLVLGPEPQSRGCQPASGSVPRARWFPLTDVPTALARGQEGHSRRKTSRPPQPPTTMSCAANGSWAGTGLGPLEAQLEVPPAHPWPSSPKMAWTLFLPVHLRKAEAAVYIILGRRADLEERIRRKQEEERAYTAPSAHWPPVEILVFGVMFPEGLPSPPPHPHPPHEVLANRPSGHKVAASLQGSQPRGVTPSGRRPEHGHPAWGYRSHGGRCSVSTSFLPARTRLLGLSTGAGGEQRHPLPSGTWGGRAPGRRMLRRGESQKVRQREQSTENPASPQVEKGHPWKASRGR